MVNSIVLIGFIQALFGILIFITKRPKHISYTIVAFWLAIMAVSLGTKLLPFDTVEYFKPGTFPILFLHGPLLYFYVSSLTNEEFKLKWEAGLHVIPLLLIVIHRSFSNAVSVNSSSNLSENPYYIYNNIYYILLIVSLIIYWILSLNLIIKHRKNIPFYFSNYTARNTLRWLIFVIVLFLVFFVAELFISYIEKLLNTRFLEISIFHINLTVFTFIMVFFGNRQSVIFKSNKEACWELPGIANEQYKNLTVRNQPDKRINELIFNHLGTNKPYLNPEYNLQMMVDELNISRQNLSHAINSSQKKNFYKLINEYRIEEVKKMLANPKYINYTILGIAFECGFNSKSTFNRIFKEETGSTPTDYKKSL